MRTIRHIMTSLPAAVLLAAGAASTPLQADAGLGSFEDGADAAEASEHLGEGSASWYGARFAGRPTASGETFDPEEYTAAHRDLPFGSRVLVTYPRTGRSVVVRINDRGPWARGRVIDLSEAAAAELGLKRAGHGTVELQLLEE